ncbi:hypothetical protein RJ639_017420 [Escallonia herrerae]|uniref:CCHC-type domain-containing protein n=1 Tax=Escallonia herrerae TaxID=1293975 RepID=A0AA89ALY5_9ASTE|nr:hypothetical protein RJ639_017420 [Escallonia herrerae]
MIAKNFKKFMRFRRNGGRRQQNASNEEKLCYKCHKPGHMKMDCPIYKREKKERRDVWERVKRRQLSKKENREKEKFSQTISSHHQPPALASLHTRDLPTPPSQTTNPPLPCLSPPARSHIVASNSLHTANLPLL